MRLPVGAAPAKLPGMRVCRVLMLGAGLFGFLAPASQAGPAQVGNAIADAWSGGDACATCHREVNAGFASNPHGRLAARHGVSGPDCEGCHGPGGAHVNGGDKARIFNPANAAPKEVDEKCLGCHQGKHANFERSAHGEGNVSCIGCHDIHHGTEKALLKAPQATLCIECHADTEPQFSMAFHHPVNDGQVQCSDCHDLHRALGKSGVQQVAAQDALCFKCHTGKAGPWTYEHAAIKSEGCTACHTPHGGPNPRLLNRADVNAICLQCHFPSANSTTSPPPGSYHSQTAQPQSCPVCHTGIHGSNTSAAFLGANQ